MKKTILTCPFCGRKPKVHRKVITFREVESTHWWVRCENLMCPSRPQTLLKNTKNEAIDLWNTRSD